ncbi:MAG: sensor histidine kinase, partial [Gammaproteobacteria bacterium]|nr:sensor histidine kinase [Gammaproteobacteria bacterium]
MAADLMEGHNTDRESAVPTRVEHHRADSIPRRVLVVALAILLLVGGVVYVAVRSIHTLGNSSDTLV